MRLPDPVSFSLEGKRALVTGATSGIGLASAVALAGAGAIVTLAARSEDKLAQLAADFSSHGWRATILPLDITKIDDTQSAVQDHGPFDILVNSAGHARHAPARDTAVKDFDAVIDLNFRGAYFLTQSVAVGLLNANLSGSLINISSQMGHIGGQDRAVYCASKFAVEGFTKAMAIEWGTSRIRVNTVCPTFIETPLTAQTLSKPELRAWIEGKIKLGRIGKVEDIMGAVVYLASDASSLVTGTSLMVDGGWTAG